jgi:hypothetical protein
MIFIDPSELRETSNLLPYTAEFQYITLSGLEAISGADIMISPDGLPRPNNDKLIEYHVKSGAKLIQLKFGHDLASSIVDRKRNKAGRLNEALSRMLRIGAMPWQALLLFIGIFSYDSTKGMATINGQLSYTDPPLPWKSVQAALTLWTERGGGLDYPLASGKLIAEHLSIHQDHINRWRNGEGAKIIWPGKPIFYDGPNDDWFTAQELKTMDDLRVLLCAIPDAGIGPERATAILEHMQSQGMREDFGAFLELLNSGMLIKVPGIGKRTVDNILWGLWRTKAEREARK